MRSLQAVDSDLHSEARLQPEAPAQAQRTKRNEVSNFFEFAGVRVSRRQTEIPEPIRIAVSGV